MKSFFVFTTLFFTLIFQGSSIAGGEKIEPYSHEDFDESYCVRAMPAQMLLSSSANYKPPTVEWVIHRTLKETVQLTPEVFVEVEQGGCEAALLRFTFFVNLEGPNSRLKLTWKNVKSYLSLLKLSEPWDNFIESLIDDFKDFEENEIPENKSIYPTQTTTVNFEIISSSATQGVFRLEYIQIL